MKKIYIFVFLILVGLPHFISAQARLISLRNIDNTIQGTWILTKYIYQGHDYSLPDPNLLQTFEFKENGVNRLLYKHEVDKIFCERLADYDFNGSILHQKITWVNPKNHPSCSQDLDMKLGNESFTKTTIQKDSLQNDFLSLELPLNEDIITFIWKRSSSNLSH